MLLLSTSVAAGPLAFAPSVKHIRRWNARNKVLPSLAVAANGTVVAVGRWPTALFVMRRGANDFEKHVLSKNDRYPISVATSGNATWIAYDLPRPDGFDSVVSINSSIREYVWPQRGKHKLLEIAAGNKEVWVTGATSLWRVNVATGRIRQYELPLVAGRGGPSAFAIGKDGRVWMVIGGSRMLWLDPRTGATHRIKTWSDQAAPYIESLRFDGLNRLWFAGSEDQTFGLVDNRGNVHECHANGSSSIPSQTKFSDIVPWGAGAFYVNWANPGEILFVMPDCTIPIRIHLHGGVSRLAADPQNHTLWALNRWAFDPRGGAIWQIKL